MIPVDRNRAIEPVSLGARRPSDKTTELERVRAHMNGEDRKKTFDFGVYKTAGVKTALDQLFHGKCAYCESHYATTQPVDVEHYRPKAEVETVDDHDGYWWLAMVWTNLLPSCIDCNRRREQLTPRLSAPSLMSLALEGDVNRWKKLSTGKASAFPLARDSFRAAREDDDYDAEQRLLLDPTRDDPEVHLGFYVDRTNLVSLVYPRAIAEGAAPVLPNPTRTADGLENDATATGVSAMGAVSIQVYGLNRMDLVQARSRVLRDLEFMLQLSTGLAEAQFDLQTRITHRIADRKAAPAVRLAEIVEEIDFLRQLKRKLGAHSQLIRAHLRGMLAPTAPYSAVARSWAKAYIEVD